MAGTVDITQDDLVAQFGSNLVLQVFCDDGTGAAGPRLTSSIKAGRRLGDAVLLRAWTAEQIETLVSEDAAVKSAMLMLVLAQGMLGRPEWEGKDGPRETYTKGALDQLKLLVDGQLRSVGEAAGAGTNPHVNVGKVSTQRNPHTFVFAPSRYKQSRGGF